MKANMRDPTLLFKYIYIFFFVQFYANWLNMILNREIIISIKQPFFLISLKMLKRLM